MPYAYGASTNYSSNKSTSTNTGNNNRESYRTSTTYQKSVSPQRVKTARKEYDDATGRSRLDNLKIKKVPSYIPGSTILNIGQKFRQKTLDKNVEYFKGLKSRGKATQYELTDEGYKKYIGDRSAGKIDAAGNVNVNYGRDNEGNVQQKKVVGGQTILTKEKTAEETKVAEEKKEKEYDERITKKKGRRKNIKTGSLGVTKNSADYSLGKKSLLGQVV